MIVFNRPLEIGQGIEGKRRSDIPRRLTFIGVY
jgi:hypothetical protein